MVVTTEEGMEEIDWTCYEAVNEDDLMDQEEVWTPATVELLPWMFDVEPCGGVAELWVDF